MPSEATVDFIADRRVHTRRLRLAASRRRLRQPLLRRPLARYRRLDSGDERHTPLFPQIWPVVNRRTQQRALDRTRADPYPRPYRAAAERNHRLQARRLLGAENPLPRHHILGHLRQIQKHGAGAGHRGAHRRSTLHSHRHNAEKRARGSSPPVRPHVASGGMQQELGMDRR